LTFRLGTGVFSTLTVAKSSAELRGDVESLFEEVKRSGFTDAVVNVSFRNTEWFGLIGAMNCVFFPKGPEVQF